MNFITVLLKNGKILKNHIEMYLTYNEGKFVVAKRFIRTLKNIRFLSI